MNNLFFSRFCGLLLLCSIGVAAFAQKGYKRAYTLFNAEGKEIGYDELIEALAQPDVVFIGAFFLRVSAFRIVPNAEGKLRAKA